MRWAWPPWKKEKSQRSLAELKKEIVLDEHEIPLQELVQRLKTNTSSGLSAHEAEKRLLADGPNALTPPNKQSVLAIFLKCIFGGFNALLWAAGIAAITGYFIEYMGNPEGAVKDNLYMGIVLMIVVSITGSFSFYQDRKSHSIMDGFANMVPSTAHVMRDGQLININVANVVVGDVVSVSGGDKVPADMRVIEAHSFKVDNSSLTGENEPQPRNTEFTSKNALESKNVACFSTSVIEGTAKGIVILTGDKTVVGRIARLTHSVGNQNTPLSNEIKHFVHISAGVALIIGVAFFVLSMTAQYTFIESLIYFMGMIVANVPEGIVPTVTACLTLTAVKMRKKHCLVKNLEGVETLGSTSTICSDKTGTLTQNKMTVTHMWVNDQIDEVETRVPGQAKARKRKHAMEGPYAEMMRCAALCSRAKFLEADHDAREPATSGDASEVAIMKYCELVFDGGVEKYREGFPKLAEIPFNSTNKYQVSVHSKDNQYFVVLKGAPERVLGMCNTIDIDGQSVAIADKFVKDYTHAYETLGGFGERVFGFADLVLDPKAFPPGFVFDTENLNFPLTGFRFLGLLSMIDPPRPDVPQSVKLCQTAGIKVVMVTGDHPITAVAIAKQVNIIEEGSTLTEIIDGKPPTVDEEYGVDRLKETDAIVVHGEQLKLMSGLTLTAIVENYDQIVFARTSPTQKLQIVEAFQKAGQIVAVTGDGVNDAPALRKADIGIAMGIAGTDVSKQAAGMILTNDNFASIVTGVEEGRLIFDNLKKAISYVLTSNVPEITPFMSYILLGFPLPISIAAILLIDFGTDLWPAISLAYETAETDIMLRPPRNAKLERLVNHRLIFYSYLHIGSIQAAAGFTVYFATMMYHGFFPMSLYNIRKLWDDASVNDLEDSYGQQWTYDSRKSLEYCCHGAFFAGIVIVQWADLLVAKTRRNSIIVQGMGNNVLNTSMIFTCCVAVALLNISPIHTVVKIDSLRLPLVMTAIPFGFLIVLYDELRCFLIRKYPEGWMYRETYY